MIQLTRYWILFTTMNYYFKGNKKFLDNLKFLGLDKLFLSQILDQYLLLQLARFESKL